MPDQANRLSALGYDHGDVNSDGTRSYTYDAEGAGRIMTATFPGGSASYRYDPFGRRYSKTVNGVTTVFLHDEADNEVAEFDGASGTLLRYRLYSGNSTGAPVVTLREDGYTGEAIPALDRLGSVMSTSDGYGQYLGATAYLPYGQSQTGTPPPGSGFGFAGYRYDAETGLYYVRNRYYDPRLGRWLQPDPIGQEGGVNLYAYVGNDPLNLTDPLGLSPSELGSGAFGLVRPEPGLGSPCIECVVLPALRLPRALGALYDAYQATRTIDSVLPNGADNIANAPRLTQQLQEQAARSPFAENGTLTPQALTNSREIIPSAQIGNPAVPSGFSKYSTQTYQSPSGDFQVHFYRNPSTGHPLYNPDYKTIFNRGLGQ